MLFREFIVLDVGISIRGLTTTIYTGIELCFTLCPGTNTLSNPYPI